MILKSFVCEGTNFLFVCTAVHGNEIVFIIIIEILNHNVFFFLSSFSLFQKWKDGSVSIMKLFES